MICVRCGSDKHVIHHHVKYENIHGVEDIILLCKSCHQKLHNKLRRDGLCNIKPATLNKAHMKSTYHRHISVVKARDYSMKNIKTIEFDDRMCKNILHREIIRYNHKTGNVIITCLFMGSHGKKIIYKNIGE